MSETAKTFQAISQELNNRYPQRQDLIEAMILGVIAGEHVFVIGPPGTAKSMIARELVGCLKGSRYFEILLSKNRPDAAVLGPYDMNLLREESKYQRKDTGYLTTVEFAFLDEIGKMSPTLGHDLLAALNERVKHEVTDAGSVHPIPLRTTFAASNEHPTTESEDAAALWDRLLLRASVDYLQSKSDFARMLVAKHPPMPYEITMDDLDMGVDSEMDDVVLDDSAIDAVIELRDLMRREGFTISDRRWRDSTRVLRAAAWLRESTTVEREDLTVLRHVLWDQVDEIDRVRRLVNSVCASGAEELLNLRDQFIELKGEMAGKANLDRQRRTQAYQTISPKVGEVRREVEKLRKGNKNVAMLTETQALLDSMTTWSTDVLNSLGLGVA